MFFEIGGLPAFGEMNRWERHRALDLSACLVMSLPKVGGVSAMVLLMGTRRHVGQAPWCCRRVGAVDTSRYSKARYLVEVVTARRVCFLAPAAAGDE